MKTRLIVWLALELLVASALSAAACILRRDEVKAFGAWHENPTPQTRAELERQRGITFRQHFVFAGVLWVGMAAISIPVIIAVSRRKSSLQSETQVAV